MWRQAQDWLKRRLQGNSVDPCCSVNAAPERFVCGYPAGTGGREPPEGRDPVLNSCCNQATVHIAFRGKSDDRLYIAYSRTWDEVRYYQPNGLRVFCVVCRRRLL